MDPIGYLYKNPSIIVFALGVVTIAISLTIRNKNDVKGESKDAYHKANIALYVGVIITAAIGVYKIYREEASANVIENIMPSWVVITSAVLVYLAIFANAVKEITISSDGSEGFAKFAHVLAIVMGVLGGLVKAGMYSFATYKHVQSKKMPVPVQQPLLVAAPPVPAISQVTTQPSAQ